jgi:hypothetical protein
VFSRERPCREARPSHGQETRLTTAPSRRGPNWWCSTHAVRLIRSLATKPSAHVSRVNLVKTQTPCGRQWVGNWITRHEGAIVHGSGNLFAPGRLHVRVRTSEAPQVISGALALGVSAAHRIDCERDQRPSMHHRVAAVSATAAGTYGGRRTKLGSPRAPASANAVRQHSQTVATEPVQRWRSQLPGGQARDDCHTPDSLCSYAFVPVCLGVCEHSKYICIGVAGVALPRRDARPRLCHGAPDAPTAAVARISYAASNVSISWGFSRLNISGLERS